MGIFCTVSISLLEWKDCLLTLLPTCSMLGVMTLNVGYFLSVLAGLFVGELVVGRYARGEDDHH